LPATILKINLDNELCGGTFNNQSMNTNLITEVVTVHNKKSLLEKLALLFSF
jgi:hypothetical protein